MEIPIPALMREDMAGRRFARNKENFECAECGLFVIGNGYTDHCPRCLWSMHVDMNPGDRTNTCRGMMEPVDAVYERGAFMIKHICIECGEEKNIGNAHNDSMDLLMELAGSAPVLS